MSFKIKDGIRIGTVDIFNSSAHSLNLKVKDTNAGEGTVLLNTESLGAANYTQTLQAKSGTVALLSDIAAVSKATNTTLGTVKLEDTAVQTTAANAITTTAGRTYGIQFNAVDQLVVNVPWTDTTYSQATSAVLGLVKLGSDTAQTVAANAVTATASRSYAVQLNASGQMLVNVPWTDTTYAKANTTTLGLVKLVDATVQTTAANAITTTASRTYAVQFNGSDQMVVNVPWSDTNTDTLQTSADDTTNAERFIDFVNAASGAQTAGTSANLKFNPSTSTLTLGGAAGTSPVITTSSTGTASIFNTNATTVNAFGAATTVAIGATTGTTTVRNNLTVAGNLVVNGTTTTINSSTISVDDKNLELGAVVNGVVSTTGTVGSITGSGPWTATITGMTSTAGLIVGSPITATAGTGTLFGGSPTSCIVTSIVSNTSITYTVTGGTTPTAGTVTNITTTGPTDVTADGGGITLKGATDKTFNWVDATDAWTSSEHLNLASGKAYYINGTSVLNSTTLGTGVVNSSLTKVGLTSAGFVKSDASGNLTVDTNTYLTAQSTDFKTVTITDTDSGYTWVDNGSVAAETVGDTLTIVSGAGVQIDVDSAADALRIRSQGSEFAFSEAIQVTTAAPSAGVAFTIDSWTKTSYRAIKYVIGVVQGTTLYQTSELMVFNDGTTAGQMTEYAVFSNDPTKEVTYTIDFSGATALLKAATPTATTSITFNIHRTVIIA